MDGVAMGSLLGTTFAKIFRYHQETKSLKNCTKTFKPIYYGRNINKIFILFEKAEQVLQFVTYLN